MLTFEKIHTFGDIYMYMYFGKYAILANPSNNLDLVKKQLYLTFLTMFFLPQKHIVFIMFPATLTRARVAGI